MIERVQVVIAAGLVALLAGCGSDDATTTDLAPEQEAAIEASEAEQAGAFEDDLTAHFEAAVSSRCMGAVLSTPTEVELYRSAGDTVVSDPDDGFGMKVVEPDCTAEVEAAIAEFP